MCNPPTRFRVNQVPSLLNLLFAKFPNLTSPITVQPPFSQSDHAFLQWTYTSAVPQLSPIPGKINSAHIDVHPLTSLALECNWELPEKSSINDLRMSFRAQTSLLTSKGSPPIKTRKPPAQTLLHTSSQTSNPMTLQSLDPLQEF